MKGYYYDYESDRAYDQGRRDADVHRRDYDFDRHSDRERDRAYFDGIRDRERENQERRDEERREEEYRERLYAQRMREEQEMRNMEEQEYWENQRAIDEQMEAAPPMPGAPREHNGIDGAQPDPEKVSDGNDNDKR